MTGFIPPALCRHVIDISEINPVASIGHVTDITSEPACLNSVLTALCISRGWLQLQGFAVHSIGIPLLCRYLCRTYAVFHGGDDRACIAVRSCSVEFMLYFSESTTGPASQSALAPKSLRFT